MTILDFKKMKQAKEKITVVTCYDNWSAKILADTGVDCILVGDSLGMVIHGHTTTIPVTIEMMALHTAAVTKNAGKKFVISDLPFLSYRKGLEAAVEAVEKLMHAGAHAIKLEGADGNEVLIHHLVHSGVPIMGHIGLTPQSVHQLGGYRVQGRDDHSANSLLQQAHALENAGCFALVLECVPEPLAKKITEQLSIPTIGIGAGRYVDGQVLVFHDLLGLNSDFKPKFAKQYINGANVIKNALNSYNEEVKNAKFPIEEHCF